MHVDTLENRSPALVGALVVWTVITIVVIVRWITGNTPWPAWYEILLPVSTTALLYTSVRKRPAFSALDSRGFRYAMLLGGLLVLAGLTRNWMVESDRDSGSGTVIAKSEAFIDAFYSFDSSRLREALSTAPESQPELLYYQGWAEGGNYEIVRRAPCTSSRNDEVKCPVTVRDDLISALRLPLQVTDTFTLTFSRDTIRRVEKSSNDPAMFEEALRWVRRERAAVIEVPCRGFFSGGPTPADCVRAIVQGFEEFANRQQSTPQRP